MSRAIEFARDPITQMIAGFSSDAIDNVVELLSIEEETAKRVLFSAFAMNLVETGIEYEDAVDGVKAAFADLGKLPEGVEIPEDL